MDEIGTAHGKHVRRHLMAPETLARTAALGQDADLTRGHGQGNGIRVHAVYFAAVSLVALALMIAAVLVVTARP